MSVRHTAVVVTFLFLALSAAPVVAPPEKPCAIAIVGGRLIDGNGGPPVEESAVLIRGNRIAAVGPKARVSVPACAEVVDAAGKTVLPGLINSNTHVSLTASAFRLAPGQSSGTATETKAIARLPRAEENVRRYLKLMLMQGITSVRDTNGFGKPLFAVKPAIDRNEIPGSRLFLGGLSICSPDFYKAELQALGPATNDRFLPIYKVPDDLRSVERPEIDYWKLTLSGKAGTSVNSMSDDLLKAIVAEGHRAGKVVDAHVSAIAGIRSGLDAGLDVMEHPNYSDAIPMPLVQEYVAKGVFLSPLHSSVEGLVEILDNPSILNDPVYKHLLPADEYAELQDVKERLLIARERPDIRHVDLPGAQMSLNEWREAVQVRRDNLKKFIRAGAKIVMSTDTGGTHFNFPESAWHVRELATYVRFGMTPIQALQTATKNAADVLRRGNDLGTLEPHKLADVIVVNGDPLVSMDAFNHVEVVIKDGIRYK
jgi:imidazolonepropionase-like amidohydrolase